MGKKRTVSRAGDCGKSESSDTAACRCSLGLGRGSGRAAAGAGAGAEAAAGVALEALERDIRQVLVEAEPLESLRDELKLES